MKRVFVMLIGGTALSGAAALYATAAATAALAESPAATVQDRAAR